jgi:hypothetical protein
MVPPLVLKGYEGDFGFRNWGAVGIKGMMGK